MFQLRSLLIASICIVLCSSFSIREKRQDNLSYTLPAGVEEFAPTTVTSFRCTEQGYFADVEADCKLFHVCLPQEFPDGKRTISQFTFACGNQTVFNQFSLTCAHPDDAVPCASSSDFFYLNERIGQPKTNLHNEEDIVKLASLINKN